MTAETTTQTARPWLVAAAGLFACNQLGVALTAPLLANAPLLLIALSPLGRNLLLAAPITPIVPLVLVAALRRAAGSLVGYQLGLTYGDRAVAIMEARSARLARLVRLLESAFQRSRVAAAFLVPRGSSLLAGAGRMDRRMFMAISTAGHAFWAAVTYKVGDSLSEYIRPVLDFIVTNMLPVTAGFIALVVVQLLFHRARRKR